LRVNVFITPRTGILDPQGRAVGGALKNLGFEGVAGVHIGRYIVIDIDAPSKWEAEAAVKKMCEQLLANPNIEDYRIEIDAALREPVREGQGADQEGTPQEEPAVSSLNSSRKLLKDSE
jgi:phosphoribosylformylglycinamidine synthase PurS subunit